MGYDKFTGLKSPGCDVKRRSQIAMTADEITRFLEEDGYTLQLATNGRDGFPHLVAMWYCVDEGLLHFNTYATSQKAKNLERDPRITCMVEAGTEYHQLRGVVIQGVVERVDARDEIIRVSQEIVKRYPRPEMEDSGSSSADAPRVPASRVVYRVRPQHTYSWDHRKLPTGVH